MHLTNKEILNKLLSYSEDLKHHYQLYQLLLFHFQNKEPEKFFGLIEDNLKQVHPIFQTVFKTFLKDKEKIVNALQLHYSNAKLDYDAPSCPECGNQLKKYDFQKPSKIPYLETTGMPTRILLRKRRFKCYHCSKMMVAETSIVKKNHQIPRIINQKIAQKLIEKISMTDIAHQLSISTSTVIRKLNDFHFKHDFSRLPEIMSWEVETVRGVTVSIGRWR
ncbi:degenerate transposase [Streptococcus pneumoniae]|nr:degenerate transposase [Streptococcus pneumoniae]